MNKRNKEILYIVIPCYNEEEMIDETTRQLKIKVESLIKDGLIDSKSKVLYVNDGSKDSTWDKICTITKKDKLFKGICLSRNRGHQNALLAGLMYAKEYANIVISMDADLQDDISVVDEMILKHNNGCEIVYGVRSSRKKDTWFKRITAQSFYKFMIKMGVDLVYNHADYRLTSKRVLDELEKFSEVNLFLRGLFPLIGFKSDVVYYERNERIAGVSKYPLKKMLNFAWDGITSFSTKPIRFILTLGMIILTLSIVMIIYSIARKILGYTVPGWTFIACSLWFLGGVQMFSIGIVGEYIGKIYIESKRRPKYIIEKETENDL